MRGLWHGKARGTIPRSGVFATMTGREGRRPDGQPRLDIDA